MPDDVTIGGDGSLFVGEDKTIEFELVDLDDSAVAVDMTGWSTRFDVRKKDTSADPIFFIEPLPLVGTFNSVRATNTQRAVVTLTDDDLNLFKAATYRWSWKRMDAGSETVLGRGDFKPEKATAP